MGDVAAFLPTLVAALMAGYELRMARGGHASRVSKLLAGFGLCVGAAMAVRTSVVTGALEAVSPVPNTAFLLGRELMIASLCLLALTALTLEPADARRLARRWHLPLTAVTAAGCAVLLVAAHTGFRDGAVVAHGTGRAAVMAFDSLYGLYSLWALTLFLLVVPRHVRHVGPGHLRVGLVLITAAVAVGMLWALWGAEGVRSMALTGRRGAGDDPVAVTLSAVCLGLGVLGATAARWGAALTAPTRWLRAYRRHRALEPLWSALHAAVPGIALPDRATGRSLPPRDAEFALYRRVIEIRDAYLALRPYRHPDTPAWTADAAARHPVPASALAAAQEAAALAAAVECTRARVACGPGGSIGQAPRADTFEAEVGWLLQVSEAFARCPLVEDVRARTRARVGGT
ncbi:hypothetical protein GCM10027168_06270 [Streptomyces capparidis]